MGTATLEQAQQERHEAIEANRELGIVEYKSNEKQSEAVYEVIEGRKHLPGGKVCGPGQRFHPTERQVKNGSLAGKAREITRSELRDLKNTSRSFAGTDFREMALRALPMTNHALTLALNTPTVTAEDFAGIEPAHKDGYTKGQVEELIAKKQQPAN